MVIRVPRTRKNSPSTCFTTSAKPISLTNVAMSCSTLHDGAPFEFCSGCVSEETVTLWDCHNFSCAQADSTAPYPSNTKVKLILFCLLASRV